MLGHGHSFRRILAWQLATWAFWAAVAPWVLRRSARFMAVRSRTPGDWLRLAGHGTALMTMEMIVAAQMTVWIQPLAPVVAVQDFTTAWLTQLPARFVIDLLIYGLLVFLGGASWTHRRARALEIRESRLEADLARAELHALRLEIEPHFLFNTLNAITALVRLKENRRAVDMLVELGDFMRGNLDRPAGQMVALSTELDWVRRYVGLQGVRFADRLDVRYQIADDCLGHPVPTLLLQPIVENAFRHGLSRQTHRGRLEVRAWLERDSLRITVADDGVGVPPGFDGERDAGTGLRNVRGRLAQLYGQAAALELRPRAVSGTVVTLTLPLEPGWRQSVPA